MTTATTVLALLPVLTSTGRGSDVMVPMAIPSFGGMLIVAISIFVVPVLYSALKEFQLRTGWSGKAVDALSSVAAPVFFPAVVIYGRVVEGRRRQGKQPNSVS
jgi:hypothetical protein